MFGEDVGGGGRREQAGAAFAADHHRLRRQLRLVPLAAHRGHAADASRLRCGAAAATASSSPRCCCCYDGDGDGETFLTAVAVTMPSGWFGAAVFVHDLTQLALQ